MGQKLQQQAAAAEQQQRAFGGDMAGWWGGQAGPWSHATCMRLHPYAADLAPPGCCWELQPRRTARWEQAPRLLAMYTQNSLQQFHTAQRLAVQGDSHSLRFIVTHTVPSFLRSSYSLLGWSQQG